MSNAAYRSDILLAAFRDFYFRFVTLVAEMYSSKAQFREIRGDGYGRYTTISFCEGSRARIDLYDLNQFEMRREISASGFHERPTSLFLLELLEDRSCFVDIGAHIGYYALLAARRVGPLGRVYAFEPQPLPFRFLLWNLQLNNLSNARAIESAAWHSNGRVSLYVNRRESGKSSVYRRAGRPVKVKAVRPDSVVVETVNAIKIDAEGSEMDVLRGCSKIISRDKPVLVLEWNCDYAQSINELESKLDFLTRMGPTFVISDSDNYKKYVLRGPVTKISDLPWYCNLAIFTCRWPTGNGSG